MKEQTIIKKFQANLQRDGVALQEMKRLLEAFVIQQDMEKLKELAIKDNLLGKTSNHMIKAILSAFKRRFFSHQELPSVVLIAKAICSKESDAVKNQILFPYYILTDPLIENCYRKLVLQRLETSVPEITTKDVIDHLIETSKEHPELATWSEYLRLRWSRGFLSLLRYFGLMERHPRKQLKRLWLLPESFAFFWLWYWEKGRIFLEVERNDLWKIFQLSNRGREDLLIEGQLKGWWNYQRLGEIVNFQSQFESLEEWLKSGLA